MFMCQSIKNLTSVYYFNDEETDSLNGTTALSADKITALESKVYKLETDSSEKDSLLLNSNITIGELTTEINNLTEKVETFQTINKEAYKELLQEKQKFETFKSSTSETIGENEKLKKELAEMGMFDACYKQPIPRYVKKLGVVTASTGAAVRDIINVAKRRNPYVEIILYPATVQGEYAVPSIVEGIRRLEQEGVDVMIVGRGGGSIEDLWAFNSREVAQAVFDCQVPVISAVGHETDTTIIDFVSDLRAPTPSAGAELAVCDMRMILTQIGEYKRRMTETMLGKCARERMSVENYSLKLQMLSP